MDSLAITPFSVDQFTGYFSQLRQKEANDKGYLFYDPVNRICQVVHTSKFDPKENEGWHDGLVALDLMEIVDFTYAIKDEIVKNQAGAQDVIDVLKQMGADKNQKENSRFILFFLLFKISNCINNFFKGNGFTTTANVAIRLAERMQQARNELYHIPPDSEEVVKLKSGMESLVSKKGYLEGSISELENRKSSINGEITGYEAKVRTLNSTIARLTERQSVLLAGLTTLSEEIRTKRTRARAMASVIDQKETKERELSTINTQIKQTQDELNNVKEELEVKTNELRVFDDIVKNFTEQKIELDGQVKELSKTKKSLEDEKLALQNDNASLKTRKYEMQDWINSTTDKKIILFRNTPGLDATIDPIVLENITHMTEDEDPDAKTKDHIFRAILSKLIPDDKELVLSPVNKVGQFLKQIFSTGSNELCGKVVAWMTAQPELSGEMIGNSLFSLLKRAKNKNLAVNPEDLWKILNYFKSHHEQLTKGGNAVWPFRSVINTLVFLREFENQTPTSPEHKAKYEEITQYSVWVAYQEPYKTKLQGRKWTSIFSVALAPVPKYYGTDQAGEYSEDIDISKLPKEI